MTYIHESTEINGITIKIYQNKGATDLHVTAYEVENGIAGKPFTDCTYTDPKKARARYNLLKRKAGKGL